jgi:hypothetical protein
MGEPPDGGISTLTLPTDVQHHSHLPPEPAAAGAAYQRFRRTPTDAGQWNRLQKAGMFPWWHTPDMDSTLALHSQTRIEGKEGLLVDCGAWDNLVGDKWAWRQGTQAMQNGMPSTWREMDRGISVEGVGKQAQSTSIEGCIPGVLADGQTMDYTAPVLPDSELPALLGLRTLEEKHAVIDTRPNKRKLYLGADIQIIPGPNTTVYDMEKAPSGHLLLPVSNFGPSKKPRTGRRVSFNSSVE